MTVDSVFYPLTAGIPATLTCLIQTTIDVTDDLTFTATWEDVDGNTITSSGHNNVSDAISTAPKVYISTVSINPLTITGYNGTTTCTVTVTSTLVNVVEPTVSDYISLNVNGMFAYQPMISHNYDVFYLQHQILFQHWKQIQWRFWMWSLSMTTASLALQPLLHC